MMNQNLIPILDNGHGNNTPGKRSPQFGENLPTLYEWEFNRDIVKRIAAMCQRCHKKYGLTTYDFSDTNNQLFRQWDDNPASGMINDKSISQFRIDKLTYDGLHPNKEGYEYMYPSINSRLMSL